MPSQDGLAADSLFYCAPMETASRAAADRAPARPSFQSSSGLPLRRRIVVLANRAPLKHEESEAGSVTATRTASGLVTALEPLLETHSGTWVAHASGNADAQLAGFRGGLPVPADRPRYRLRFVALADDTYSGYYHGFANEGLWALCHAVNVPPVFRTSDFLKYRSANARFAAAVVEEAAGDGSLVLVQDYHFALAPRMLRRRLPSSTIATFWHIPWPSAEVFDRCPQASALIHGLLGSHVLGFQTPGDCRNFLDSAGTLPGATIDRQRSTVTYQGTTTTVRAYPVGVEWASELVRTMPPAAECREHVCRDLQIPAGSRLVIGVDRLDYSKGLDEKCRTVERLLETQPDWRGRLVLVQVAEPSRGCLPAYRAAREHLVATVDRVNARFGGGGYRPIVLIESHREPADVYRLYRAADVCYVGSLRDGMNLVAKEFACARQDERGVLVLSRFAGASRQLRDAVIVDPYDIDAAALALGQALTMEDDEQERRMHRLRRSVERRDARWWADRLLNDAHSLPRTPPPAQRELAASAARRSRHLHEATSTYRRFPHSPVHRVA
jgi:trehalose 6-phosphate synthase